MNNRPLDSERSTLGPRYEARSACATSFANYTCMQHVAISYSYVSNSAAIQCHDNLYVFSVVLDSLLFCYVTQLFKAALQLIHNRHVSFIANNHNYYNKTFVGSNFRGFHGQLQSTKTKPVKYNNYVCIEQCRTHAPTITLKTGVLQKLDLMKFSCYIRVAPIIILL